MEGQCINMNKKNIIRAVILLLVIVAGGYFYSYVKRDIPLYNTDYSRSSMVSTIPVCEGSDYEYEFQCDKDNLTGVKLLIATADTADKSGTMSYAVYDTQGKQLTDTETVRLSKLKNGRFTKLDFDTIKNSSNNTYVLKMTCAKAAGSGAMVAVTPDDNQEPAILYTYIVWDAQTMVVFAVSILYLVFFIWVLMKIFRK